jgi:hypothetical protein
MFLRHSSPRSDGRIQSGAAARFARALVGLALSLLGQSVHVGEMEESDARFRALGRELPGEF